MLTLPSSSTRSLFFGVSFGVVSDVFCIHGEFVDVYCSVCDAWRAYDAASAPFRCTNAPRCTLVTLLHVLFIFLVAPTRTCAHYAIVWALLMLCIVLWIQPLFVQPGLFLLLLFFY